MSRRVLGLLGPVLDGMEGEGQDPAMCHVSRPAGTGAGCTGRPGSQGPVVSPPSCRERQNELRVLLRSKSVTSPLSPREEHFCESQ